MLIKVKVYPGSKKEEIEKINDDEYEVYLKERAEKGKANIELVKILSKEFKVSVKNIKIKNPSSRKKIIEIKKD